MKVIHETSNQRMLRLRPWLGWGVGAFFASGGLLLIVAGQLHTFSCRRTEPMPAFRELSSTRHLWSTQQVLPESDNKGTRVDVRRDKAGDDEKLLLSQVLQAPARVPPPANDVSGAFSAQAPGEVLTEVELYFGLSKPGGGAVSETEWQNFVDREITPRFKDGLTVLSAYGQYQGSSRRLVKENVRVVVLIYRNIPQKEMDIKAIINAYKQGFQQESVLRTTSLVKAAF